MAEEKKTTPKRDWAIHMNQVHLLGRVAKAPKTKKDEKVAVQIVVPAWKKGGGRQWIPFSIDVVGEARGKAKELKIGDYFGCTARFAERKIKDDNDDPKNLLVLQMDPFRDSTFRSAEVPEDYEALNPPIEDVCFTRVLLAGRHFINKKQREEGDKLNTPVLREGNNGKYCYVKLTYQDPFQEVPEGEWPKDIFFDFSLSGATAERVAEHCRYRAQLLVVGELGKKEADFTIGGKTPKEPKVSVLPGGFSFANLDRSGGGGDKKPTAAEGYDENDKDDVDLGEDDDLPID
jgi:hypothetical protein